MRDRRLAREKAEIDVVFLQQWFGICVHPYPIAILGQNAGELKDVSATVYKHLVLGGSPDQVTAINVFVQHRSRKAGVPDVLQRLDRASFFNLMIKIETAGKSEKA